MDSTNPEVLASTDDQEMDEKKPFGMEAQKMSALPLYQDSVVYIKEEINIKQECPDERDAEANSSPRTQNKQEKELQLPSGALSVAKYSSVEAASNRGMEIGRMLRTMHSNRKWKSSPDGIVPASSNKARRGRMATQRGRLVASRSKYITQNERSFFLSLVEERKDILFDKSHDYQVKINKQQAWREITSVFNAAGSGQLRTQQQLRKLWEHVKGRAKKFHAAHKIAMRTGGEPPPVDADVDTSKVLRIISDELEETGNGDSSTGESVWAHGHNFEPVRSRQPPHPPFTPIEPARPPPVVSASGSCLPSTFDHVAQSQDSHCTSASLSHKPSTERETRTAQPKRRHQKTALSADDCYRESMKLQEKEHEIDMEIKEKQLEAAQLESKIKEEMLRNISTESKIKEKMLHNITKESEIKEKILQSILTENKVKDQQLLNAVTESKIRKQQLRNVTMERKIKDQLLQNITMENKIREQELQSAALKRDLLLLKFRKEEMQ